MQSIEITSLVGHSPFSITVCDITHSYCYFVISGVTSSPITINAPIELSGAQEMLVIVTDSIGCETMNYINCPTPTPIPTMTPTMTPTRAIINCNCIAFTNVGTGSLNFGYTQCNGTIFNGEISQSTTLYFCGRLPFADANVNISVNDICINNSCQTSEITPTPTQTPTNTPTPTITKTPTPTPTTTESLTCTQWLGISTNQLGGYVDIINCSGVTERVGIPFNSLNPQRQQAFCSTSIVGTSGNISLANNGACP